MPSHVRVACSMVGSTSFAASSSAVVQVTSLQISRQSSLDCQTFCLTASGPKCCRVCRRISRLVRTAKHWLRISTTDLRRLARPSCLI